MATSSPVRSAPQPRCDLMRAGTSIGMNTGVTITSEPSGAKIEIDGIVAGYTPITIKVTPLGLGFTVTLIKDGFAKWMAQTFSTAQPYGLHAQLRELPKQSAR